LYPRRCTMVRKRKKMPSVGDLVVATVREVFEYGAYVTLDEYGDMQAYLPWSEVASRWVRNIRDLVKEGHKIVVKVIRVHARRGHIDVSLKRVSDNERRNKMIEWKRAQKAEKILEMAAKKLGKSLDDAYREAGWKLEDYYGEIMTGLEQAVMRGIDALLEAGVPEDWAKALKEEVDKHIEIKRVKIKGVLTLQSLEPDGVERIREVLRSAYTASQGDGDVRIRVYTIGPPRYRVEVEANDYKTAEKVLERIVETATRKARKLGVTASFVREKA
jgi:translation initiation factor 2 subunit 1